jgi:hypothetical protein
MMLADQLEREKRAALLELPTLPAEDGRNVEEIVPTVLQAEELVREEHAVAPQVAQMTDLVVIKDRGSELSPRKKQKGEEEHDVPELLPSMPKRQRQSKPQGFRQACEVCGRHGMYAVEKLRAHLKTHIKEGSRTCPIPTCSKMLKNAAGLFRHLLLSHHRLECDRQGGALFPDVKFVIPPGVILECFQCDARFGDSDELDAHIRKHMSQKCPRECNLDECIFNASTQDDMARHVIAFHYQLQAECSACGVYICADAHECSIRPEDVVNTRVTVRWLREKDIAWYAGTVKRYLPATDSFEILYDDGTLVNESLSMRYWRPLAPVSN